MSTSVARDEYLKRYLQPSNSDSKKSKKKSNKKVAQLGEKAKGMRLIDDDTFLQMPPPTSNNKRGMASSMAAAAEEDDDEDMEDEQSSDEESRLQRCLQGDNYTTNKKKSKRTAGPSKFKADSFVSIGEVGKRGGGGGEGEEGDISPPRRQNNKGRDQQVQRRRQSSPVASTAHSDSDQDSDVVRRRMRKRTPSGSPDTSPVRRRREPEVKKEPLSPPPRDSYQSSSRGRGSSHSGDKTTTSHSQSRKAGLVSKEEMQKELERLKAEEKKHSHLEVESGRGAETRKRETLFHTSRRPRDTPENLNRKLREAAKQEELDEKYQKWNRGVSQLEQRESKLADMKETMQEGFSRYADDEAMNKHLKEQLLQEDPMGDYFKTKRHKVQMREGVVYPTYKGHWTPNRFGIPPGYRWDGVDRSNGFEAKMALTENRKRAKDDMAYRSIAECDE